MVWDEAFASRRKHKGGDEGPAPSCPGASPGERRDAQTTNYEGKLSVGIKRTVEF